MPWWCPVCIREIPDNQVTFEEHCGKCGTFIGDCQEVKEEEIIEYAVELLISKGLTPEDYEKAYAKLEKKSAQAG